MPAATKKRVTFQNIAEDKNEDKRRTAADVLNLLSQLDQEIDEDLADSKFFNQMQFMIILSAMTMLAYFALSFLSFSVVTLLFVFGLITFFAKESFDKFADSHMGNPSNIDLASE